MSSTGTVPRQTALYIDPPSRHFLGDRLFEEDSNALAGDQILAPYSYLRERLKALSIHVRTADYLPKTADGNHNLYISLGLLDRYQELARRPDLTLSAFFAVECPIVEPSIYRALPRIQRYFRRVFSWSGNGSIERFTGRPLRCEHFRWPQSFDAVHQQIWDRTDRKFLVMINTNKLPRIYWQELYTERLRAVEFFNRTNEVDLFGRGWEQPAFRVGKTWIPVPVIRVQRLFQKLRQQVFPDPLFTAAKQAWRGVAHSKSQTLGNYKFALCYENMILNGWITEKLFDCFFAGTVPIYWGAPEIADFVPPACFIDKRVFASYPELSRYLKSLSTRDVDQFRANARDFLSSKGFEPFQKATFAAIFERIVQEDS